jgi:excisionase family DNA binding protein
MVRSDAELSRDLLNDDPLLTCEEVAELFRVVPPTVARWAAAGRLDGIKSPGNGLWRFRESVVREALNGGEIDDDQDQRAR